jgi:hypothetical protein
MPVIAVTGAHGTGKTTLAAGLAAYCAGLTDPLPTLTVAVEPVARGIIVAVYRTIQSGNQGKSSTASANLARRESRGMPMTAVREIADNLLTLVGGQPLLAGAGQPIRMSHLFGGSVNARFRDWWRNPEFRELVGQRVREHYQGCRGLVIIEVPDAEPYSDVEIEFNLVCLSKVAALRLSRRVRRIVPLSEVLRRDNDMPAADGPGAVVIDTGANSVEATLGLALAALRERGIV